MLPFKHFLGTKLALTSGIFLLASIGSAWLILWAFKVYNLGFLMGGLVFATVAIVVGGYTGYFVYLVKKKKIRKGRGESGD